MKRDIVNKLTKLSQKAWEDYVKLPTTENRERFEKIDDELRVELEFDRNISFNHRVLGSDIVDSTNDCNS